MKKKLEPIVKDYRFSFGDSQVPDGVGMCFTIRTEKGRSRAVTLARDALFSFIHGVEVDDIGEAFDIRVYIAGLPIDRKEVEDCIVDEEVLQK